MQKKKNTKFKVIDRLIIILCLTGAALSGTAFWREYNRTLVKLNEEPVGLIVFKNRTAHRKIENRVAWDRLKQSSPVYNGDTVRTAELSHATITFQDQVTNLSLSESTLIQVFYDSQGVRIDFVAGSLGVSSGGSNVYVSRDSSVVEVGQNSRADLNQSSEGFDISVQEGQALYDGRKINSGQLLSLLSDGSPDTNPAIVVTSLGKVARVFGSAIQGMVRVDFAWNVSNFDAGTQVVIELAQDRDFSRIVQTERVSGASAASLSLRPGVYWWRAYPVREGTMEPAGRSFSSGRVEAILADPVVVTSPAQGENYAFPGESRIPLSWSAVDGAEAYHVEIASTPDMALPVVSRRVQGNSLTQTGLDQGRWYWRVSPVYPGQSSGGGAVPEVREFSISRGVMAPAAPALTVPAQNDVVAGNSRLVWTYDARARSWLVEVADNPQMSNPLVKQNSASNFYSLPAALQTGKTYYWRVTALGEGSSTVSPLGSFTMGDKGYEHRAVFPPDNYSVASDTLRGLRFTFRSNTPYKNYFQVSSRGDFASLEVNAPVETANSYVLPGTLRPGTWYWRILAEAPAPLSSPPRRFTVVSAVEAPVVSVPARIDQDDSLTVEWNSLHFSNYRVNVYDAANPRRSLIEQTAAGNSLTIPGAALGPGNYIVSVQGFNAESARSSRIAGASSRAAFTVAPREETPADREAAEAYPAVIPAVLAPETVVIEPAVVEPVAAEPEPVVLQTEPPLTASVMERLVRVSGGGTAAGAYPWNGYLLSTRQLASASSMNFMWEGRSREYRFALYRADGGVIVAPVLVSSPSFVLSKPGQLTEGEYVWQVFEPGSRGTWGELPSMANRFTLRAAPLRKLPTSNPGVLYGSP
ncbi:MAG: hypothetical protein LBO65_05575 [Spirochaetaceae bacterium]|jgi:hypothetical protein|nr:hypothetical protein [Spirochaetaceae bacterium]